MTSTLLYRQLPSMMSTFNTGPSFLHHKRAHSPPPSSNFTTRDADSSSSDSDSPPPPRKRRTTATSSEEEGKPSLFAFQPPAARASRGGKRAHDSEEDEGEGGWGPAGRIGDDEDDNFLDIQAQESSSSSGTNWRSTAFPPNPKRFKRTLSDGFTQMGLSEGGRVSRAFEEEEVVHPYRVEEPEEVGPAVWLGSAPASQEDEVEISGVGEEEEERARNEMAVGFWRGNEGVVPPRDPSSLYVPSSYLSKPTTHHLPPPSEAWLNQQRGVVIYAPPPAFNAPFPIQPPTSTTSGSTPPPEFGYLPRRPFFGSRTSSNGEMQLDADDEGSRAESPYSTEEPWPGASITELPDEEEIEMDAAGEMDVD